MTDREADTLIDMIANHWSMEIHEARPMWRGYLLGQDAEVVTRAITQLAKTLERRPRIADVKSMVAKIKADLRPSLPLPPRTDEHEPPWVSSWRKAREAGDFRYFVEQIPALAEDEDETHPVPDELDKGQWVQVGEYGYEACAYDFSAPPDMNRLCAMHPHQQTKQPLARTVIGRLSFMLCLDCRERYAARRENETKIPEWVE